MPGFITKLYLPLFIVLLGLSSFLTFTQNSTPLLPLRVGINQWPGYETLYLARHLKYTDESSIRLVDLPSATEVIHALRNDTLEAATLTLDETLSLLADGVKLKIVAVMDISSGADAIVTDPKYHALPDLKGKKIGVETNAVGAVLFHGALEQSEMLTTDFTLVSLPVNKHARAYLDKKIDAVVTFEPVKSLLLSQGAVSIFDSSQIPGRIVDVLVVRADIVENRLASVCELIQAQFKALEYLQKHPNKAVGLMAPRLQTSSEALLESYQGLVLPNHNDNKELFSNAETGLNTTIDKLVQLMLKQGLLKQSPETKDVIDNRCIFGETF